MSDDLKKFLEDMSHEFRKYDEAIKKTYDVAIKNAEEEYKNLLKMKRDNSVIKDGVKK
jgi:hypothetical protein